jgi:hypothetical protein
MDTEPRIRLASEGDLDALVHLAAAFRDHLQQSTPADADFRTSIALLLKDASTEFSLACGPGGARFGYVQSRYRYCACGVSANCLHGFGRVILQNLEREAP